MTPPTDFVTIPGSLARALKQALDEKRTDGRLVELQRRLKQRDDAYAKDRKYWLSFRARFKPISITQEERMARDLREIEKLIETNPAYAKQKVGYLLHTVQSRIAALRELREGNCKVGTTIAEPGAAP